MPQFKAEKSGIGVSTENNAVVVTIPSEATLDEDEAKQINEEFMSLVKKPDIDAALTVMRSDNPLSGKVFDQVTEAAKAGREEGIERWAVVVEKRVKGMAFSGQLDGIETKLFEEKQAAKNWLNEA